MTFDEHMAMIQASLTANGGQCFPGLLRVATPFADPKTGAQQVVNVDYRGMTLRAHIAAQMMAAFASNGWMPGEPWRDGKSDNWAEVAAGRAVACADALILALAPPEPPAEPKPEDPAGNILLAQ